MISIERCIFASIVFFFFIIFLEQDFQEKKHSGCVFFEIDDILINYEWTALEKKQEANDNNELCVFFCFFFKSLFSGLMT